MGSGFRFKCNNCGGEYTVLLGVGFAFPSEYEKVNEDVKHGEYGEEWKTLINSEEFIQADAEKYFFHCGGCGYWKEDYGLSLYAPNNVESLRKKQYGIKTVEEWGYVPYAIFGKTLIGNTNPDFHILKKRIHRCPECNRAMKKHTYEQLLKRLYNDDSFTIKCPKCEEKLEVEGGAIRWD